MLRVLNAVPLSKVVLAAAWGLSVVGAFCLGMSSRQGDSRIRNQQIDTNADIAWTYFTRWRDSQQHGRRALADAATQQVLDWISDHRAELGIGFTYAVCHRMCSKHHIVGPTVEAFTDAMSRRTPRGLGQGF